MNNCKARGTPSGGLENLIYFVLPTVGSGCFQEQ